MTVMWMGFEAVLARASQNATTGPQIPPPEMRTLDGFDMASKGGAKVGVLQMESIPTAVANIFRR